MDESWESTPLPVAAEAVAVKEGVSPLVYMTEGRGRFRVTDATTGKRWPSRSAPAQTILRVDDRYGVVFGKVTLLDGPCRAAASTRSPPARGIERGETGHAAAATAVSDHDADDCERDGLDLIEVSIEER